MRSTVLATVVFASSLHAAGWVTLAPVITPRQEVAVAAAAGKLYLIGGISGEAILSSVEEFDPSRGSWRLVAPLPKPRHHTTVSIGSSIYVAGGYETLAFDAQRTMYRYDVALDRWSEVAELPSPRGAHASVAIDGKVYVIGGIPGGRALLVYDPGTNAWTSLAPMPTPREHLAAAAHEGKLYAASGRFSGNSNAFERYDPATNTWATLPPIPTARSGIAAAVLDGRMYVFGGEGNPATPTGVFEEVESFDFASGAWRRERSMQLPRHGIGAATIGDRIHIPAGSPTQGFGISSQHDAFVAKTPPRRAVRSE